MSISSVIPDTELFPERRPEYSSPLELIKQIPDQASAYFFLSAGE
jgi:hypothetical protein